jgi:hypothetical protein
MPTFKVRVTQVFRAERQITIEVEADDKASAIELLDSGSLDTPSFDDPRWNTGWDLQSEAVAAAE